MRRLCARWPIAARSPAASSTGRLASTTRCLWRRRGPRESCRLSPVAGQADILIVPDLEAGNMLAKQLVYLADAEMAGIVLGARVPIILTSRADNTIARLGSAAIALILARGRRPLEPKRHQDRAGRDQRDPEPVLRRKLLA